MDPSSIHSVNNESASYKRQRRLPGSGKPVIGLAGGIGSGKSLVARQFEQLGCAVINADDLAHQVLTQQDVIDKVVQWWGQKVLNNEGQLDRKEIGRCVFDSPDDLRKLEQLVHPRVHALRDSLRQRYEFQNAVKAIVEDCPLLFEVGLEGECDVVVFVSTDRTVRLARIKANRGWTAKELDSRENKQLGLDIKANRADYIVDNSENEQRTFEQVRNVFLKVITEHKQ